MSFNFGNMWNTHKKNNLVVNNVNRNLQFNKINKLIPKNQNKSKSGTGKIGTKGFWGTPTWYLFHSLAERVDEEKYKKHYMIMWNFIKEICSALPCPYCQAHATRYVFNIPITSIDTKEKLINVLFKFHNDVNLRTGKLSMSREVLEKYKSSNLNKILELFYSRFFVSYIGRRHFDDWIKNRTKEQTNKFISFYKKNLM